jgi:hypothetical protein
MTLKHEPPQKPNYYSHIISGFERSISLARNFGKRDLLSFSVHSLNLPETFPQTLLFTKMAGIGSI